MKVNVEFQELDKKKKIKRIIAREGLVILGFVGLFILNIFTNFGLGGWFIFLNILGYPIYLIIRFIVWAVKTLKPNEKHLDIDWEKMDKFIENNQYTELFSYMDSIEKVIPNIAEREPKWEEIKRTSIKGGLMETIYSPCEKLLQEKKYNEAKELANKGLAIMNKSMGFFETGDESFVILRKELKALEDKDGELIVPLLLDNRKKIRAKLESFKGGMAIVYFDLFVTPLFCGFALSAENPKKERTDYSAT